MIDQLQCSRLAEQYRILADTALDAEAAKLLHAMAASLDRQQERPKPVLVRG